MEMMVNNNKKKHEWNPSDYSNHWNPIAYLRAFYSEIDINSSANVFFPKNLIEILNSHFNNLQRKQRVLEFGAGPNLWPSFLLSAYFEEIWFCDYAQANLKCVQDWLDQKPDAHNWKPYFNVLLDIKQGHHDDEKEQESRLRTALQNGKVFQCDVHSKSLLLVDESENRQQFDMIFTCGCFEAACTSYESLKQTIHLLGERLVREGILVIMTYRNSSYYKYNEHTYTDLPINEQSIRTALAETNMFTEPVCIVLDIHCDRKIEDKDGLMINYAYKKQS